MPIPRLRSLTALTLMLFSVACAPRTSPEDRIATPEPAPELLIVTPAPAPTAEALAAEAARRAARVPPIIYVDGVRVPDAEGDRSLGDLFTGIGSIQISRGEAAALRYPNEPEAATRGVVAITTRPARE